MVAVFEEGGRRVAKVLVHSCYLEIDARALGDLHLGDRVLLQQATGSAAAPKTGSGRRGRIRRSE